MPGQALGVGSEVRLPCIHDLISYLTLGTVLASLCLNFTICKIGIIFALPLVSSQGLNEVFHVWFSV